MGILTPIAAGIASGVIAGVGIISTIISELVILRFTEKKNKIY